MTETKSKSVPAQLADEIEALGWEVSRGRDGDVHQREIDEAWVVAYDTQDVQDMQRAEELGDDFHFECREALAKLLGIEP